MSDLKELLDREAARICVPEFAHDDPVQFPRRFAAEMASTGAASQGDVEIAALLSAQLAWGRREMIVRDCRRLFALMDWQPLLFVREQGWRDLPDDRNIHRTFFARNLSHYLRGLHRLYSRHPSVEAFAAERGVAASDAPAWALARALNREMAEANEGRSDPLCLPQNLTNTALKRLNMALRWLVRDDGVVDIGLWRGLLRPSQLFIPLDVHVGNTARSLGLLRRASNDRRAVESLTEALRALRPDDPAYYDFALFGLGITKTEIGE